MELSLFIHTFFTQLLIRPFGIYLVVIFCVSAVLNTGNRMRKDFSVVLFSTMVEKMEYLHNSEMILLYKDNFNMVEW